MRIMFALVFLGTLTAAGTVLALPNPASVFCVQSGGKSEIRNGKNGQYGVCRLPDGRAVDEWAYFRAMKGKPAPR